MFNATSVDKNVIYNLIERAPFLLLARGGSPKLDSVNVGSQYRKADVSECI